MEHKKIIAVTGATGAQGGSLAAAILNDPDSSFAVRAITRNIDSPKAKALASAGAEVVAADLDDVESLKKAFEGTYGVFGVTNFWEHFSAEKEVEQARNIAEAARSQGVRHVVWSTLEDTRLFVPLESSLMPTLHENYKVPHFDGKGEADALFSDLPTTYLVTSFYWDNFIHFGMGPQPGPDGVLAITMPMGDKKLAGIAAEDIGKCAYGVFKAEGKYIGKRVGVAGGFYTGQEMAEALSRATGHLIRYNEVSPDEYRALGFPGADDLGNMFQFKRDFNDVFLGNRDLSLSKELNPELKSFSEWLADKGALIPIPEPSLAATR